jgi:hypothetical protein
VIGQGVEDLGAGKDMETNKKDVVGEQHETSELIGKSSSSKGFISEITYYGFSSDLGDFRNGDSHYKAEGLSLQMSLI